MNLYHAVFGAAPAPGVSSTGGSRASVSSNASSHMPTAAGAGAGATGRGRGYYKSGGRAQASSPDLTSTSSAGDIKAELRAGAGGRPLSWNLPSPPSGEAGAAGASKPSPEPNASGSSTPPMLSGPALYASFVGAHGEQGETPRSRDTIHVKVTLVGDKHVGKTALAARFVDDSFSEEYIPTTGVNYSERRIPLGGAVDVAVSVFDVAGAYWAEMAPLAVSDEAVVVLFVFDLTQRSSLQWVKDAYRQVQRLNPHALAMLVGAKFDLFLDLPSMEQTQTTMLARRFAQTISAPLVYSSASHSVNVQKCFKIALGQALSIDCRVEKIRGEGEPLIEY